MYREAHQQETVETNQQFHSRGDVYDKSDAAYNKHFQSGRVLC